MPGVRLPRRRVRSPDAESPAPTDRPTEQAPPEVPPWRMGIVIAMIVAMLAALVWVLTLDSRQQTIPTALPTAALLTPTPTADASPAAVLTPPNKPPPPLDGLLTNDWRTVVETYFAYHGWLAEHPRPELLANIQHPECECYAEDLELLTAYEQIGAWWIYEADTVVHSVVEVSDPIIGGKPGEQMPPGSQRRSVHLKLVMEIPGSGQLVDSTGKLHHRVGATPKEIYDFIFVRETLDAPWKLRSVIYRGEVAGD